MTRVVPRLHAVTPPDIFDTPDLDGRAAAIGATGTVAVHARGRTLPGRTLYALAERLRRAAPAARLVVNDRADIAYTVGADGIHLPGDGLPVDRVRRLVGPDMLVGRSTHSPAEARAAAAAGADYVFLGPIWETGSHRGREGIGVGAIQAARPARVIAIGGITAERIPACLEAGAHGVAVISALWGAPRPGAAADAMLLLLGQASGPPPTGGASPGTVV